VTETNLFMGLKSCNCPVFAIYGTCNAISCHKSFCDFILVVLEVRVQCPVWLFSVVPWFRSCTVYCFDSGVTCEIPLTSLWIISIVTANRIHYTGFQKHTVFVFGWSSNWRRKQCAFETLCSVFYWQRRWKYFKSMSVVFPWCNSLQVCCSDTL